MHSNSDEIKMVLDSVFSDETEMFRSPAEVSAGDRVTIRLRVVKDTGLGFSVISDRGETLAPMERIRSDGFFDWYEASLVCGCDTIKYCFRADLDDCILFVTKKGSFLWGDIPGALHEMCFSVIPGFHVPEWAIGALQYQIFPDRFCNGDSSNDVNTKEYYYARGYVSKAPSWDSLPVIGDYRVFYGGDLQGIIDKLDYIESLGIEAIYMTPIFISPSSHRYDIQDYDHVDPHLTVIKNDISETPLTDKDNRHALQYMKRTIDEENLKASDDYFAWFCGQLHSRGIRIILDGVFNHCGSFHRWMDHEGIYDEAGIKGGAFGDPGSRYRDYFSFNSKGKFESWYDIETLPKLNYDISDAAIEEIMRIGEKWAAEPYCIDGWRLDVGADLGHGPAVNHRIWKEFRRRVRSVNPDILIVAEHYGDPSPWLEGDEWDTVMNYDAFMDPLTFFLTGMEKHSDIFRPDVYQNGIAFFNMMNDSMAHMPGASIYCAMNQLSNHDHSRFMTRTNSRVGRLQTAGSMAAGEGIHPGIFREAAVVQMTWPGAPTIYYGDEAGLTGWTDPDNRRTYPWGHEDRDLIEMHRALARLRREHPVLKKGSLKPLGCGEGYISYARFDDDEVIAVICNNNDRPIDVRLPLAGLGISDGSEIRRIFRTDGSGYDDSTETFGYVESGRIGFTAERHSSYVITVK